MFRLRAATPCVLFFWDTFDQGLQLQGSDATVTGRSAVCPSADDRSLSPVHTLVALAACPLSIGESPLCPSRPRSRWRAAAASARYAAKWTHCSGFCRLRTLPGRAMKRGLHEHLENFWEVMRAYDCGVVCGTALPMPFTAPGNEDWYDRSSGSAPADRGRPLSSRSVVS